MNPARGCVIKALVLGCLLWFGAVEQGLAHETTRSYVTIAGDGAAMTVTVQIAYRDLEVAVWLDEDLDGRITWAEVTRRIDPVSGYVTSALTLAAGGPCEMTRTAMGSTMHAAVGYLDLTFRASCPQPQAALRVTTQLFADLDPDHRVFLTANLAGQTESRLLGSADNTAVFSADPHSAAGGFASYFTEGVRHLLQGTDHLVFLLLLILPAAVSRDVPRKAALRVLGAVTGFTLAHALTLTAAATSILRPPTVFIEVLIALSIVITAIDNLRPFLPGPRAAVAAFFGLIHGFGFATAIGALPLSAAGFATALIGFNLGIEVAQVGVVMLALPAFYALGSGQLVLRLGSFGAMGLGVYWVLERVAG